MGYKLKLTKSEYTVLKVLAQNVATPLSSEKISLATGCEISPKNVAFHVHNINKKAKNISNRILIKNIAKIGYFLK